jgi:hypothetical protein
MGGDKPFFKGYGPDEIQKKSLAGTVFADDKADTGAIVCYPFDIFYESSDFVYSPNLYEVLAGAGYNPGSQ